MKYIKGLEVIETPYIITIGSDEIALSDSQLRQIGFKPIDEVIYEQADKLTNTIPTEDEIKEKLIGQMQVTIPHGGLPYKLGYTWEPKIVNNNIIFELVREPNGVGTNLNPIIFCEYVILMPNAFYLYEGNEYVYVGAPGKASSWDQCKDDMELM